MKWTDVQDIALELAEAQKAWQWLQYLKFSI
jgi:Fe-S-cluster formation regulator IscX/YfhJ